MKVTKEVSSIYDLNLWMGAEDTRDTIAREGKQKEFMSLLEEQFPNGVDETELNDYMWFDSDDIYAALGIEVE